MKRVLMPGVHKCTSHECCPPEPGEVPHHSYVLAQATYPQNRCARCHLVAHTVNPFADKTHCPSGEEHDWRRIV